MYYVDRSWVIKRMRREEVYIQSGTKPEKKEKKKVAEREGAVRKTLAIKLHGPIREPKPTKSPPEDPAGPARSTPLGLCAPLPEADIGCGLKS